MVDGWEGGRGGRGSPPQGRAGGAADIWTRAWISQPTSREIRERRGADARTAEVAEERPEVGNGHAALHGGVHLGAPARHTVAIAPVAPAILPGCGRSEVLEHVLSCGGQAAPSFSNKRSASLPARWRALGNRSSSAFAAPNPSSLEAPG